MSNSIETSIELGVDINQTLSVILHDAAKATISVFSHHDGVGEIVDVATNRILPTSDPVMDLFVHCALRMNPYMMFTTSSITKLQEFILQNELMYSVANTFSSHFFTRLMFYTNLKLTDIVDKLMQANSTYVVDEEWAASVLIPDELKAQVNFYPNAEAYENTRRILVVNKYLVPLMLLNVMVDPGVLDAWINRRTQTRYKNMTPLERINEATN